jgi:hypothetical protein
MFTLDRPQTRFVPSHNQGKNVSALGRCSPLVEYDAKIPVDAGEVRFGACKLNRRHLTEKYRHGTNDVGDYIKTVRQLL